MVDGRGRLYLLQTCLLAFVLRAAVVSLGLQAHSARWFFGQASELGCLATSFNSGHGLGSPFGGSTGPSAFLAPGYPLLIAVVFRLFGSFSRGSQIAILALQILFATGTVASLMICANRLFGRLTANLAGLAWAVSLPLLWVPAIFWETSFSIFAATALLALAASCRDHPGWRTWVGFAVLAAAAILTNPSLLTLIVSYGAWAAWRTPKAQRGRPLAAAALCALLCAPWVIRNAIVMHAFVPLRSNSGYELWQGNHPGGDGFFDPTLHPNVNAYEFQRYRQLGELAYMQEKGDLAKTFLRQNPAIFIELCLKRFFSFWTAIRHDAVPLMTAYLVTTTVLGLAGLALLLKKDRTTGVLFLLPVLFFPLPYYFTHPDYRFRLVLDPALAILGMYLLTQLRLRKVR
jgi:4-amino-4-deoxy-L-arabinose transferase-like glycosyltransferase